MGAHRLVCGDSCDPAVLAACLGAEKPHLCVTDPPYGVEYEPTWRDGSQKHGRKTPQSGKVLNDDRASWAAVFSACPCSVAYVWHGALHVAEVARSLAVSGFEVKAHIVWVKKQFVMCRSAYHWRHEPCFYAVRKGADSHWNGSRKQSTVWADIVDQWEPDSDLYACKIDEKTLAAFPGDMTTVWEIARDKACGGGHSTQKPLECMARPIRNSSKPGEFVFEPFSGSGTTIMACESLGRRCLAIELSPGYVAVALERFKEATGKVPVRIK